jgi:DNA-binding ferritin-like protein (Dps family)
MVYGYAKVDVESEDTFKTYVIKALNDVATKCEDNNTKQKVHAVTTNIDQVLTEFMPMYMKYDNYLWTISFIHMRFSKLVEYIIALDRVLFLFENGVKEVKLVRLFNDMLSTRNILIYARK